MPRYWWVNHKQTFRQEIDGTHLWSPKRNANGARNVFYDNMRAAAPGDLVLSFADGLIRHVGRMARCGASGRPADAAVERACRLTGSTNPSLPIARPSSPGGCTGRRLSKSTPERAVRPVRIR